LKSVRLFRSDATDGKPGPKVWPFHQSDAIDFTAPSVHVRTGEIGLPHKGKKKRRSGRPLVRDRRHGVRPARRSRRGTRR
jgi:hypothetical protein